MIPSSDRQSRFYCGTDDGVAVIEACEAPLGAFALVQVGHHDTNFGMIRKLAVVPGGYVALGQREVVFRADHHGKLLWQTPLDDFGIGLAVSGDGRRVLVATGVGAVELCIETGTRLNHLPLDGVPLSAATYGPGGERILGNYEGGLCAYAPHAETELWWRGIACVPQGMWTQDGAVYVRTSDGLLEVSAERGEVNRHWGANLQDVTVALVADGRVHLATADGWVHTYDQATGAPIGDGIDDLADMPRTLVPARSAAGEPHLVVGGRGGYLSTYRVNPDGPLTRVRDTYLRRGTGRAFRLYCQ
jgi:hypothetical protein